MLYRRGLTVIATVLVIQLLVLLACGWMFSQSESAATHRTRSASVTAACNWASALLSGTTLSCLAYAVTGDEECLGKYMFGREQTSQQMVSLQDQMSGDPDQLRLVLRSRSQMDQLFQVLDVAAHQQPMVAPNQRLIQLVRLELIPSLTKLFNLRSELLQQVGFDDSGSGVRSTDQSAVALLLAIGFVDVLAAAGLLFVYSREVTSRLAVLSENSTRLGRREKLSEPIEGADELAQLDSALRDLDGSMQKAEQRKQEVLSAMGNDLRTPLSNALNSLTTVVNQNESTLSGQTKHALNRVHTNLQTVVDLINQFLEIEQIEAGGLRLDYADIDVRDLINKAAASVSAAVERKKLTVQKPRLDDEFLQGDEQRLVRVLSSLLERATKESPDGGTITVGAKELTEVIEFSVSDQGPGIPPEQLEKIFDRFQRSASDGRKSAESMSASGLALAKAIVEAHSGTMVARSVVDKGTIFTFRIPKRKPQADSS